MVQGRTCKVSVFYTEMFLTKNGRVQNRYSEDDAFGAFYTENRKLSVALGLTVEIERVGSRRRCVWW